VHEQLPLPLPWLLLLQVLLPLLLRRGPRLRLLLLLLLLLLLPLLLLLLLLLLLHQRKGARERKRRVFWGSVHAAAPKFTTRPASMLPSIEDLYWSSWIITKLVWQPPTLVWNSTTRWEGPHQQQHQAVQAPHVMNLAVIPLLQVC